MENYKELFAFAKEAFKEELERLKSIDQKASNYLSVLTLLLGVAGFFIKWVVENFIPPRNTLEVILVILTILIVAGILFSWFFTFSVLRLQKIYTYPLDTETINFFTNNTLVDIYYYLSVGIQDAVSNNRSVGDTKSRRLNYAYRSIRYTVVLLLLFGTLFGLQTWSKPEGQNAGGTVMSDTGNQQKPTPQPPTPQPPTPPAQSPVKPTPGIKPPKFPSTDRTERIPGRNPRDRW
ncbi:MAG TPA: hypothetical protein VF591_12285 [Pyrinomonadaceae bacterium]|jgi:hypothetical protein